MLEINKIYNLDCLEGLKLISSNSIDLTITSPPYDSLRKYSGFQFNFKETAKELYRVTKRGGVVVWVVGDATTNYSESGSSFKQALFFKHVGFKLYDTMIYAKKNPIPLTHRRYEQQFEYMFVLSKGKPKTFNPLTEDCQHHNKSKSGYFRHNSMGELKPANKRTNIKNTKIRTNIWYYKVGKGANLEDKFASKHPAIFPEQLVEDHMISWSNEGDVIMDIFMGSGTTAKVALKLNRLFIGFEISSEYCHLANKRIEIHK